MHQQLLGYKVEEKIPISGGTRTKKFEYQLYSTTHNDVIKTVTDGVTCMETRKICVRHYNESLLSVSLR
jgi:hypothetical protein